jgi:gamma-glutamyl hercynylcysteine S-oxide hydrolase
MCRLAGYVGDPIALAEALYRRSHSLEHQAYKPAEQIHGSVNVDGTGVAWWDAGDPQPLRYVTPVAPWQDANLPTLSERLTSGVFLAAVRSASPGIAIGPGNVAPFTVGNMAAVHNGRINGFRSGLGRELIGSLSIDAYEQFHTISDSLAIFLTVIDRYDGDLVSATIRGLADVSSLVRKHGGDATLNFVISDGVGIVAARHSVDGPLNSLYTSNQRDGSWVASEPLDDDSRWNPVPDHHLVHLTSNGIATHPLEGS